MNRTLLATAALAALAAACGEVKDRPDCRSSAGCPAGEYCAHTSEGSVCWIDASPPTTGGVTVACGTAPCPRDGTLLVTATARDDEELLAVEATIDLAPGRAFPLAPGGGSVWTGTIDLATIDFPAFTRELLVTVRARDGARNEATAVAGVGQRPVVTRVRWEYAGGASLSPPGVMSDGTVLVARSALTDQLLAVNADGTRAWSLTLGAGAGTVTAPPSIGAQAIWVGANDGKLYAVEPDGSAELASRSCTASGVARGPPAILTTAGADVAFGAFGSTQLVASAAATCAYSPIRDEFSSGAAIDLDANVVAITTKTAASTLRRFSWAGSAFEELWNVATGGATTVTPALDSTGRILTVAADAGIDRTTTAGVSLPLATLSGSIDDSPIVLSNGDIVVGDASGKLHRIDPSGSAVWDPPVDLGAAVHAPMALKLAGGPVWFLVATADGKVHAVGDSGAILWSGPLTGGTALGAGNLHTPPGSELSTAYFGGADGKLYAVIVDGALDTAAPWPKAWHDARNTSRAAPSP